MNIQSRISEALRYEPKRFDELCTELGIDVIAGEWEELANALQGMRSLGQVEEIPHRYWRLL